MGSGASSPSADDESYKLLAGSNSDGEVKVESKIHAMKKWRLNSIKKIPGFNRASIVGGSIPGVKKGAVYKHPQHVPGKKWGSIADSVREQGHLYYLERGGVLVHSTGLEDYDQVQFGVPPNSIADLRESGREIPLAFIVTGKLFDRSRGISTFDIEPHVFYNFYQRGLHTDVVCDGLATANLKALLHEAFCASGKKILLDATIDFEIDAKLGRAPNFKDEAEVLTKKHGAMTMPQIVNFVYGDVNHSKGADFPSTLISNATLVSLKRAKPKYADDKDFLTIRRKQVALGARDYYRIRRKTPGVKKETDLAELPLDQFAHAKPKMVRRTESLESSRVEVEPFAVPRFGITVLGKTHGFGDQASSVGYVIWAQHRGILVDPPVDSTEFLSLLGVPARSITTVILTKCRSDHDAGAFQKLFCETNVSLVTTETIKGMFLRRYSALSGHKTTMLERLVEFVPVKCGVKHCIKIHGCKFTFWYALSTSPSLCFSAEFDGASFAH